MYYFTDFVIFMPSIFNVFTSHRRHQQVLATKLGHRMQGGTSMAWHQHLCVHVKYSLFCIACSTVPAHKWVLLLLSHCTMLSTLRLCWVDLGWIPGTHQNCSVIPLFKWIGERKYNKRLTGQDTGRERSYKPDSTQEN